MVAGEELRAAVVDRHRPAGAGFVPDQGVHTDQVRAVHSGKRVGPDAPAIRRARAKDAVPPQEVRGLGAAPGQGALGITPATDFTLPRRRLLRVPRRLRRTVRRACRADRQKRRARDRRIALRGRFAAHLGNQEPAPAFRCPQPGRDAVPELLRELRGVRGRHRVHAQRRSADALSDGLHQHVRRVRPSAVHHRRLRPQRLPL